MTSDTYADAALFAHKLNIERYQRILLTNLTAQERSFVERRLAEERAALEERTDATPSTHLWGRVDE